MENFYQTFKQLETEAPNFWKNPENDLTERIEVFEKYGQHENYIPSKEQLPFNLYCIYKYVVIENRNYERHRKITMLDLIDELIEILYYSDDKKRFKELKKNGDIKTTKRNYIPSEEALDRYRNILIKQVLKQDLYSFTFDW